MVGVKGRQEQTSRQREPHVQWLSIRKALQEFLDRRSKEKSGKREGWIREQSRPHSRDWKVQLNS